MAQHRNILGLIAWIPAIMVVLVAIIAPASAEFFGCNDTRGKMLYRAAPL